MTLDFPTVQPSPLSRTIAIVGCGTAGLAVSACLAEPGFDVRLFEKFDNPLPVGAGLMLQPTGLACMAQMGLLEAITKRGQKIYHLYGDTCSGRMVMDLRYQDLDPGYYGLGVHRAALFDVLFEKTRQLQIPITTGCDIKSSTLAGSGRVLIDDQGIHHGPFDLVIDASGRNSALRQYGETRINRPYPFSALWSVLDDPGQAFAGHMLRQRYHGAAIMIGVMAMGKAIPDEPEKATFFWSLPPGGYETWRQQDLAHWRNHVSHYWPEIAPLLQQFKTHDDLFHAAYSDIIMKRWDAPRLAFIGDAGHNSSPQLGQGANLALLDALTLAGFLTAAARDGENWQEVLPRWSQFRERHTRFYQFASRALTPFFQSNSRIAGWLRDLFMGPMHSLPWVSTQMQHTL